MTNMDSLLNWLQANQLPGWSVSFDEFLVIYLVHRYLFATYCREITDSMRNVIIGSLKGILSCNFTALDPNIFLHRFMTLSWTQRLSYSMKQFKSCIKWQGNLTKCLPPLINRCESSSLVAVKVIRLHMSLVKELLGADPDLRVIHLVRDPRGIVIIIIVIRIITRSHGSMRVL